VDHRAAKGLPCTAIAAKPVPPRQSPRPKPAQTEMGAGIAASPHCAERRICRCSVYLVPAARKLWFPASRSWLTSSGVAFHRTALSEEKPDFYSTALPEGSLVFRCPARLKTEVFAQNRPMFRGPSWGNHSCVPLRSPDPTRRSRNRVALETDTSSGASSRLARNEPESPFQLPAGGDRFFYPFLALPAVSGAPGRLGLPPRSPALHAPSFRVAEAKFSVISLWITGIAGTTVGTLSQEPVRDSRPLPRLPFRSPPPTSSKCLNRLRQ